jgi:hypothetical protein
LFDEDMPAEAADWVASLGYKVAHVGRWDEHLLPPPHKQTSDHELPTRNFILISKDKGMLEAGHLPNCHWGVFVIDASGSTPLDVVRKLFSFTRWANDHLLVGRRFLVTKDHYDEIARCEAQSEVLVISWGEG